MWMVREDVLEAGQYEWPRINHLNQPCRACSNPAVL